MAIQPSPEDLEMQSGIREVLKNLRIGQGLSQRDLCARMDMAQGNYQRMEAGVNNLQLVNLMVWARSLGYSVDIRLIPMEDDDEFDIALRQVFG